MKRGLLALLLWLVSWPAAATIYYVDSSITDTNVASATPDFTAYNPSTFSTSTGSDSVYKTIADVNAKSFAAGDSVLFRKGQTWRERLVVPSSGSAGNVITYGAFGSGALPILNGADLKTWTQGAGAITEESGAVFSSGFETAAYADWTSTTHSGSTAIAISTTQAANGTHASRITGDASDERVFSTKTFSPTMANNDTYYFRVYVYVPTGSLRNSTRLRMLRLVTAPSTSRGYIELLTNASGVVTQCRLQGPASAIVNDTNCTFTMDAWNYIEASYKVSTTVGGGQLWVNGVSVGSAFNINTSAAVGMDTVFLGNDNFGNGPVNGGLVYFDNMRIASSGPIGAVSGGVPMTVWYTTLNYDPFSLIVSGAYGTLAANLASVDAAGEWFWDDPTDTLYAYALSDPAAAVEVPTRDQCIVSQGTARDYITIRDLEIRYALYYTLKNSSGSHWVVDGVTSSGSGHGSLVFDGNSGVVGDVTVQNSTVSYANQLGGSASHEGISIDKVATFLITQNTVHHTGEEGIDIKDGASSGVVSKNVLYSNGTLRAAPQINIDAVSDVDVSYNIMRNGSHMGISIEVEDYAGHYSTSGIAVHHNLIYANAGGGIGMYVQTPADAWAVISADIYHNTIYGNATVSNWGGIYDFTGGLTTANYGTVNLKNNLFFGNTTVGGSKEIRDDSAAMGNWTIDHNMFKSAAGNDHAGTNSIATTDPLVVNGASDFTLQVTSPARNAGVSLSATYQAALLPSSTWPTGVVTINQNTYGPWEVGAYVGLDGLVSGIGQLGVGR